MKRLQAALEGDKPIAPPSRARPRTAAAELRFLSAKPALVVLNSDEGRQRVSRGDGQSALPAAVGQDRGGDRPNCPRTSGRNSWPILA